jgi:predicted MPP superfamily phosphohydrolase
MTELSYHALALVPGAALLAARLRWPDLSALALVLALLMLAFLQAALGLWVTVTSNWHLFGAVKLTCHGWFLQLPAVLLALGALDWRGQRRRRATVWPLGVLGLWAIAADAFLIEPHWLEITHHRIETTELDQPLRLVVVADLQTDAVGAYEERVLRAAQAAEPDLLLFAGDYLHLGAGPERAAELERLNRLLRELDLSGRLGAVAVGGNCDWLDWPEVFAGTRIRPVRSTDQLQFGPLTVTALEPEHSRALRLLADVPGYHLVLGHHPDFALGEIGADLLLAGHCHGGQVRLPFLGPPLILSDIPRRWTDGLHELAPGQFLCVSRGVGLERGEAPPIRFLCRPELVVIDLVPAP